MATLRRVPAGARFRQRVLRRRLTVRAHAGPGPHSKGGELARDAATRDLFESLHVGEAIGAEWGEGFETIRGRGGLERVDVDTLNERLAAGPLACARFALCPDEAYGMVFAFEDVIVETESLRLRAWEAVAELEGFDVGRLREWTGLRRRETSSGARRQSEVEAEADAASDWAGTTGLVRGAFGVEDAAEAERLTHKAAWLYRSFVEEVREPPEGMRRWLAALHNNNIPCAVAAAGFDRATVADVLDRMGLSGYFTAMVCAEDGMESKAQRFLSAAMKIDRPPSKCAVFTADPLGVTAAHNASMKAVALAGRVSSAHELRASDLALPDFGALSIINVRRLFSEQGAERMDLELQRVAEDGFERRKPRPPGTITLDPHITLIDDTHAADDADDRWRSR
mmetsp:Transcript_15821/g.51832  ORF Transcript_15821/g.51832 Transcript_15821/m.51832 type:complete len:397 (-) Transcript_15821:129-1319(-)